MNKKKECKHEWRHLTTGTTSAFSRNYFEVFYCIHCRMMINSKGFEVTH